LNTRGRKISKEIWKQINKLTYVDVNLLDIFMRILESEEHGARTKNLVDRDIVDTSFEKWAKPGHFSRTPAKGPKIAAWDIYWIVTTILRRIINNLPA
jgi:hypothetical protein